MKQRVLFVFALLGLIVAGAAPAQGIKWHPGHYIMFGTNDTPSQVLANMDEIARDTAIKGVQVRIRWSSIEKSKGVYDFTSIDAYLRKLKSLPVPKRLVVRIIDRRFNTTSTSGIVPDYLMKESIYRGGLARTKTGYAARLWEQPVMDRLIALYRAIGTRYDADPFFEGIATEETTLALDRANWPAGYSHAALTTQYKRLVTGARAAMPRSNVFLYTNWMGADSLASDLIQSLTDPSAAAGGSNIIPNSPTQGQRVWTGELGADFRGVLPLSSSVETGELGGNLGNFTPKQINDYAYKTLRVNHLFWVRNTWSGSTAQRWSTGILPFLRTNPPIHTNCPSSHGLCVR